MVTTIQISEELKALLAKRKISEKETYEDIIWDLIEDTLELSQDTKDEIEAARAEAARGETISLEELKRA
jgi:predicted transcriptional regulator